MYDQRDDGSIQQCMLQNHLSAMLRIGASPQLASPHLSIKLFMSLSLIALPQVVHIQRHQCGGRDGDREFVS